jgi:hypothetical protein
MMSLYARRGFGRSLISDEISHPEEITRLILEAAGQQA